MASLSCVRRLLDVTSSQHYYIEYEKYFFNHIAHGIIALWKLGANEDRLNRFIDWSAADKLPSDCEKAGETKDVNPENVNDYLGKKKNFYGLREYFANKLRSEYAGDERAMVSSEFPKIMDGFAGSAVHGPIHIGYGLAASSAQTVVDGLAFLTFTNAPLLPSSPQIWENPIGDGVLSLEDALEAASAEADLMSWMKNAAVKYNPSYETSEQFGKRLLVLLSEKADVLLDYAQKLRFPDKLRQDGNVQWTQDVARWLTECALRVFSRSAKKNNFFLLHGVSSAWSLEQIYPLLSESDRKRVTAVFISVLLAVNFTVGAPPLDSPPDASGESWETLLQIAMKEDRGEHDYKVLHICRELSETGDEELQAECLSAAYSVMHLPRSWAD